jgi:hypothetical protein
MICAQSGGTPPISVPLVREGDFALSLCPALGLGEAQDESDAETRLGASGVVPRNGWIADYPVTPDIIGELQKAISAAARSAQLSMSEDEALGKLGDVVSGSGLAVSPYPGGEPYQAQTSEENYPSPSQLDEYYAGAGPPVITCYNPPPNYYYLYAWIPYPFLWGGFWFPGYFILHDFHKTITVHNRVLFVSNHFNDVNVHRVFRIDPLSRFNGKTYAGIGASRSGRYVSTGIPRSDRSIFHASRQRVNLGNKMASPHPYFGKTIRQGPPAGGKAAAPHGGTEAGRPAPRGGGSGGGQQRK